MKTSVGKRQTLQFYNNNSDIKVLIISGPPGGINKWLSFISSQSIVAAFTNQHFIVRVLKTAWNDSPRSKMQLYGWEICKIASTHNIRYKVEWGWQIHRQYDLMWTVSPPPVMHRWDDQQAKKRWVWPTCDLLFQSTMACCWRFAHELKARRGQRWGSLRFGSSGPSRDCRSSCDTLSLTQKDIHAYANSENG